MPLDIRFGTDGWRALIARDYTFDNVAALSRALAAYLWKHQKDKAGRGVAVGYDTRFLSADFARECAEALAAAGIPVLLSQRDAPTPAIAWATRSRGLASGVMITASHNPPGWNGFKFFNPLGGPADRDATNAVERALGAPQRSDGQAASVEEFDPRPALLEQMRALVDFETLRRAPGRVVVDPVHGTGRGYVDELLRECGWEVSLIRDQPDPLFGGILPDPANPACHGALVEAVTQRGADLGLAHDPDADRFGIVDGGANARYLTPNQVLAILYVHLIETRGPGPVARTLSTTGLLDAIARRHGQEVIETPVGFKWVGAAIEERGALLGGEESGGLSIKGHYGGKDGVLANLLLAEVWARHRKPLWEVYCDITREYGEFHSSRIDLHLEEEAKDQLMERVASTPPASVAGQKVRESNTADGVKLTLEDGSWLLMRPSGTEPLVRVYTEAASSERLEALAEAAREMAS